MSISFNKTGYDPFIDFLKTYSILVVVFCHGFPYLQEVGYPIWGGENSTILFDSGFSLL